VDSSHTFSFRGSRQTAGSNARHIQVSRTEFACLWTHTSGTPLSGRTSPCRGTNTRRGNRETARLDKVVCFLNNLAQTEHAEKREPLFKHRHIGFIWANYSLFWPAGREGVVLRGRTTTTKSSTMSGFIVPPLMGCWSDVFARLLSRCRATVFVSFFDHTQAPTRCAPIEGLFYLQRTLRIFLPFLLNAILSLSKYRSAGKAVYHCLCVEYTP
jgi:hypothetical protein